MYPDLISAKKGAASSDFTVFDVYDSKNPKRYLGSYEVYTAHSDDVVVASFGMFKSIHFYRKWHTVSEVTEGNTRRTLERCVLVTDAPLRDLRLLDRFTLAGD